MKKALNLPKKEKKVEEQQERNKDSTEIGGEVFVMGCWTPWNDFQKDEEKEGTPRKIAETEISRN